MNRNRLIALSLALVLGTGILTSCHREFWEQEERERSNQARCRNQVKQVSLILRMWANDHDGRLPDRLSDTYPEYLTDTSILVCPSVDPSRSPMNTSQTKEQIDTDSDYVYVGAGLTLEAAKDKIVFYEPFENHKGRGRNVLYGDGHVEWEAAPEE